MLCHKRHCSSGKLGGNGNISVVRKLDWTFPALSSGNSVQSPFMLWELFE